MRRNEYLNAILRVKQAYRRAKLRNKLFAMLNNCILDKEDVAIAI